MQTTTATLEYTAVAVAPQNVGNLAAAMAAVTLAFDAIETKVGCSLISDTTTTSGLAATRTIVFGLPYSTIQQFNGNNALPLNSNHKQYYVVTTSGASASLGELLFDNGLNDGEPVTVLSAITGELIVIANASGFAGGTISLTQGHLYEWSGSAWTDEGATLIGKAAFQSNFPQAGGDQAYAFNNLYTHALGGALGSVISELTTIS
jgi:uncharacterized membrane protein